MKKRTYFLILNNFHLIFYLPFFCQFPLFDFLGLKLLVEWGAQRQTLENKRFGRLATVSTLVLCMRWLPWIYPPFLFVFFFSLCLSLASCITWPAHKQTSTKHRKWRHLLPNWLRVVRAAIGKLRVSTSKIEAPMCLGYTLSTLTSQISLLGNGQPKKIGSINIQVYFTYYFINFELWRRN